MSAAYLQDMSPLLNNSQQKGLRKKAFFFNLYFFIKKLSKSKNTFQLGRRVIAKRTDDSVKNGFAERPKEAQAKPILNLVTGVY